MTRAFALYTSLLTDPAMETEFLPPWCYTFICIHDHGGTHIHAHTHTVENTHHSLITLKMLNVFTEIRLKQRSTFRQLSLMQRVRSVAWVSQSLCDKQKTLQSDCFWYSLLLLSNQERELFKEVVLYVCLREGSRVSVLIDNCGTGVSRKRRQESCKMSIYVAWGGSREPKKTGR